MASTAREQRPETAAAAAAAAAASLASVAAAAASARSPALVLADEHAPLRSPSAVLYYIYYTLYCQHNITLLTLYHIFTSTIKNNISGTSPGLRACRACRSAAPFLHYPRRYRHCYHHHHHHHHHHHYPPPGSQAMDSMSRSAATLSCFSHYS